MSEDVCLGKRCNTEPIKFFHRRVSWILKLWLDSECFGFILYTLTKDFFKLDISRGKKLPITLQKPKTSLRQWQDGHISKQKGRLFDIALLSSSSLTQVTGITILIMCFIFCFQLISDIQMCVPMSLCFLLFSFISFFPYTYISTRKANISQWSLNSIAFLVHCRTENEACKQVKVPYLEGKCKKRKSGNWMPLFSWKILENEPYSKLEKEGSPILSCVEQADWMACAISCAG